MSRLLTLGLFLLLFPACGPRYQDPVSAVVPLQDTDEGFRIKLRGGGGG